MQSPHTTYSQYNIHRHICDISPPQQDTPTFPAPSHMTGLHQPHYQRGGVLSNSEFSGRIQVAWVKKSPPRRTKYRGHVPPRLDTVLSNVRYVPPITGSAI